MYKYVFKDKMIRSRVSQQEIKTKAFKILFSNQYLTKTFKSFLSIIFLDKINSVFKSQICNRCVISGHSRFIFRKFGISRHSLKSYFNHGLIPALRQSSW